MVLSTRTGIPVDSMTGATAILHIGSIIKKSWKSNLREIKTSV